MKRAKRDAAVILLIALTCGLASALPPMRFVHGWSIDILTALRWEFYGRRHPAAQAPAVVIAIDEETHETPPFDNSPTATWTPEIGRVLTAVAEDMPAQRGEDIDRPAMGRTNRWQRGREAADHGDQ